MTQGQKNIKCREQV